MNRESTNQEHNGSPGEPRRRRTDRIEPAKAKLRDALDRPIVAASLVGGAVAAAAGLWGATEAALGAFAGFVVYRMLRKRRQARV
jgi:hypothetical protein